MGVITRKPGTGGGTPASVGLGNVTNDAQVKASEKGAANGVATLDGTGKVPAGQLPAASGAGLLVVATANAVANDSVGLFDNGTDPPRLIRRRADGSVWLGAPFTAAAGAGAYTFYRLNIANNNAGSRVGVIELVLRTAPGGPQVAVGGTASASSSNGGQPASRAFDGFFDPNQFGGDGLWSSDGSAFPQRLMYQLTSALVVVEYVVYSSNTLANSAKDWTLEGSNDGSAWTVLDTRTNQTAWTVGEGRTFIIGN